MNINKQLRFLCAYELTREIFVPKIEAIIDDLKAEGMSRYANAIVASVLGGADLSRFDTLEKDDVPAVTDVKIEFQFHHCKELWPAYEKGHSCKTGSVEEARASMATSLRSTCSTGVSVHGMPLDKAVRLPYSLFGTNSWEGRDRFTLRSGLTEVTNKHGDQVRVPQLTTGVMQNNTRRVVSDPLLARLWMKFEAQNSIAIEGLTFYDNLMTQLFSVRTLKSLKEKYPELHADFIRLNGIVGEGTALSVEVLAPAVVKRMAHLLRKNAADRAAALAQATADVKSGAVS